MAVHRFDAVGPDTIRIRRSERGPHKVAALVGGGFPDVLRLIDPPHETRIERTEIVDGMFLTKRFGELEILMLGPLGEFTLRARRSQIEQIRDWLSSSEE